MFTPVFFVFSFLPFQSFQTTKIDGLNVNECMEAVSLCSTFAFDFHYDTKQSFVPLGYRLAHETGVTPLLNQARIFKKGTTLNLVFRGTVDATNSWLENIHFIQVPAQDSLFIDAKGWHYYFSEAAKAQVHSGYVLGIAFLWRALFPELLQMIKDGTVNKIIFTGHSQGGALAQLFMAQLDLFPEFEGIELISYSFGSPNVGNKMFANDFDRRFTQKNCAFRFVNTEDIVCKLPMVNQQFSMNKNGISASFDLENLNDWFRMGKALLPKKHQSKLDNFLDMGTALASELMLEKVGNVVFPEFSTELLYAEAGKLVFLDAEPVPSWFETYLAESKYTNRVMGFIQSAQRRFKVEETIYQHLIFNYYNAIYRKYEPKGFRRVFLKELPKKMM